MPLSDKQLGDVLVEYSYLTNEELEKALKEIEQEEGGSISEYLFDKNLLTPKLLDDALAEHFKLPFYDPGAETPNRGTINKLPEKVARKFKVALVYLSEKECSIVTSDPAQDELEKIIRINVDREDPLLPDHPKWAEIEEFYNKVISGEGNENTTQLKKTKISITIFKGEITKMYSTKSDISSLLTYYSKPLATRFQSIIENSKEVAPSILTEIIRDAIMLRASDIHFEPQSEDHCLVRFRVDGVMHEAGRIPRLNYEGVLNRIKIESSMRIDEHFTPQDGAIRHETQTGDNVDIRVSTVPVVDGEKVVMRILASYVRALTLKDLGYSKKHREILNRAANKPFGMLLTTGPTGSGKSTTLYALVIMRNTPDINISTIEDPVEYKIKGINHIQVNTAAKLTFESGLRALVRQDPDIILVGEIRDGITADIAVNAALTGHLLFSTLHANTAVTAVPRLTEMGVEPFLLASTLEVVIGQRLGRRICSSCLYSYTISAGEAFTLFPGASVYFKGYEEVTLYKGKGCEQCGGTGYRGRVGLYELLEITPGVAEAIAGNKNTAEILSVARQEGMQTMFEDGLEKALTGTTTIEELLRSTSPPDDVITQAQAEGSIS